MESFHKLDIPLIHLTTKSEREDQERYESERIIKNAEFDSKPIMDPSSKNSLDPNTISVKHDTNPSTSNINSGNAYSFGLIVDSYFGYS